MRAPSVACLLVLGLLSTRSTALPVNLETAKAVAPRATTKTAVSPHARQDDGFPDWAKAAVGAGGAIVVGAGAYLFGKPLLKWLGRVEEARLDIVSVHPEQVYGG